MKDLKITAHIPARFGSERVKNKNLRLIGGKPLLAYAIENAQQSKLLTDFYVNTESAEIAEAAQKLKAKVFKRDPALASGEVTQDTFNYDFISKNEMDILVLINPVNPLITAADIDSAINYFFEKKLDTLVSVTAGQTHSFYLGKPINFNTHEKLPRTQDINPVTYCNWALCIWNAEKFKQHYEQHGYALFVGNTGYYEIPFIRSVKISTEDDFNLAEILLTQRNHAK